MKVKWSEAIDIPDWCVEEVLNNAESVDWSNHYEGEVIGTNSSFWHGETITVACNDGMIRTVNVDKVTIIR